jgi:hypothetical protein
MILFVAAVATVAAVLHMEAYRFFLRNPPLNTLILSVLALGVGLSFRAVLTLQSEVGWTRRFRPEGAPVAPPPLLAPLAAVLRDAGDPPTLSATVMRSVLDGVESRLDERRETLRYLIALLVFLGLLGTFWGLLITAQSVGDTIRSLNVTGSDPIATFAALRAGLEAPLAGMGTAFSTSLFGLASSLVLGFLDLQASQAQNRFASEVEGWLTGLVLRAGDVLHPEPDAPRPSAYLQGLLGKTVEGLETVERRLDRASEDDARLLGLIAQVLPGSR